MSSLSSTCTPTISPKACCAVKPAPSCCSSPSKGAKNIEFRNYKILESIYRVAIASFALFTQQVLFTYSFIVGFGATIAYRSWNALHNLSEQPTEKNRPVCAQGYMEMLSNRRYPDWVNLTVTALFIAVHIEHIPRWYVPLSGITFGIWTADLISSFDEYQF